jgi:hypothetical protein
MTTAPDGAATMWIMTQRDWVLIGAVVAIGVSALLLFFAVFHSPSISGGTSDDLYSVPATTEPAP